MAEYIIQGETLDALADAIRSVSSVSTTWTPDEMAAYILANLVKPTTRQAAKTYTPGTSNQTIPAGTFLTGAATIAGDADLTAANIKKGVNIFGKTGTLSGIWGDPSAYGFTAVKSGSFTLANNVTTHSITHNLGMMPKFAMYCATNPKSTSNSYYFVGGFAYQTCSERSFSPSDKPSSGVFTSSSLYYNFHNMNVHGSAAFPDVAPDTYVNTMTYTGGRKASNNTIRSTENVMTLIASDGSTGSAYIKKGTYNWIVMA